MNDSRAKQNISSLMALLLFAVFAVCILAVLLSGTEIYQRLSDRDDAAYTHRTVVQYLSTKTRQADCSGMISVEDFCGVSALVSSEELEGEVFETRIYCHDGYLYELFSPASLEPVPEDGEPLLPLQSMEVSEADGSLQFSLLETNGTPVTFLLTIRSTQEELP